MPYSGIPAPRYTSPYDWSILAVGVNTAFALAESGRHDERVKPSYTHFFFTHILTRAIFPFGSARVSGRNKIFKDAYKICPSLFPPFFAVLPTFFLSSALTSESERGILKTTHVQPHPYHKTTLDPWHPDFFASFINV